MSNICNIKFLIFLLICACLSCLETPSNPYIEEKNARLDLTLSNPSTTDADSLIDTVGNTITVTLSPYLIDLLDSAELIIASENGQEAGVSVLYREGDSLVDTMHYSHQFETPGVRRVVLTVWKGPLTDLDTAILTIVGRSLTSVDIGGPAMVERSEGEALTLNANVTGTPPFEFTWYRDSIIITSAKTEALEISAVKLSHAGNYYCVVSNSWGLPVRSDSVRVAVIRKPAAIRDVYTLSLDEPLAVNGQGGVLANDTAFAGDNTLSGTLIDSCSHGALIFESGGGFTFTPDSSFSLKDSFSYAAVDERNGRDTAWAILTKGNQPPVAIDDAFTTKEDTPLECAFSRNVLANDADDRQEQLSASLHQDAARGELELKTDGTFSYSPNANFAGIDTFTYTAKDPAGAISDPAAVIITVEAVNDDPIAELDTFSVLENAEINFGRSVLANDSDADGDPLTAVLVDSTSSGSLELRADGSFRYTPKPNWKGTDGFSYRAADDNGGESNIAGVTIKVHDETTPITIGFEVIQSASIESVGTVNVRVELTAALDRTITVDYALAGGTAADGDDFSLPGNGQLVFTQGQEVQDIAVSVEDDTVHEQDETIMLVLRNVSTGAVLSADSQHTLTILDDELPEVGFETGAINTSEQDGPVSVLVALSFAPRDSAAVHYAVTGGSAGGADYILPAGRLKFTPDNTAASIPLSITDDQFDESEETVIITLSNASGAVLSETRKACTITIEDNDGLPAISFARALSAGPESESEVIIPVKLSPAAEKAVTVAAEVVADARGDAATQNDDFTLATAELEFAAGDTQSALILNIKSDGVNEPDETVTLRLSSSQNAQLGSVFTHVYTITGIQSLPSVAFSAGAARQGGESVSPVTLYASLSSSWSLPVTVDYILSTNKTTASSGSDFTLSPGTLSFAPGETENPIVFTVADDLRDEENEVVAIALTNASNAIMGSDSVLTYTIQDNDPIPEIAFAVSSMSVNEREPAVRIPVCLSVASEKQTSISYAVTGGTAAGGVDYELSSGTLTFSPVDTIEEIVVTLLQDELAENDETIIIALRAPEQAALGDDTTHTLTIQDANDDPMIGFVSAAASGAESDHTIQVKVTIDQTSSKVIAIKYRVVAGGSNAATSDEDFSIIEGSLGFTAGDTLDSIAVTIKQDSFDEPDETITLELYEPSNANLFTSAAHYVYTIQDDDPTPVVSLSPPAARGAEADQNVHVTISLDAQSDMQVSAPFSLAGSAVIVNDYTVTASSPIVFAPRETEKTVSFTIAADGEYEAREDIRMTLTEPVTNAILSADAASFVYTIEADSHTVTFSAGANGSVSPSGEKRYVHGSSIAPTPTPLDEYHFTEWTYSGVTLAAGSQQIDSDAEFIVNNSGTIQANFAINTYQLTINTNGEGSVDRSSGEFPSGSYTLTATPETGYEFAGWSGDIASTDNPLTVALTADISITANFAIKQFTLTMSDSGNGSWTLDPTGGTYDYNTSVEITPNPDPHWRFAHWSGAVSGNQNPLTVTMNSNKSIKAHFQEILCTLNVAISGEGNVSLSPSEGIYVEGSTVDLNADILNDVPGWEFASWTGVSSSDGATATIAMNDAQENVTATFSKITPNVSGVICVNAASAATNPDGSNWADAYSNLEDALNAATINNNNVWIAASATAYTPKAPSVSFLPQSGTNLIGGFKGNEKSISERDLVNNLPVLDANGLDYLIDLEGKREVALSGLILRGAQSNAIYIDNNKNSIENCIFRNCKQTALYIYGDSTMIKNCIFRENTGSTGSCVVIASTTAYTKIDNTLFIFNEGPAITNNSSSVGRLRISNCTIYGNSTMLNRPGGIRNFGEVVLTSSILYKNTNGNNTATQIDNTFLTFYCNIEGVNSNGIGLKESGYDGRYNISEDPAFYSAAPASHDKIWFDALRNDMPFVPKSTSTSISKYGIFSPLDIRGANRVNSGYFMGAYQRK